VWICKAAGDIAFEIFVLLYGYQFMVRIKIVLEKVR